MKQFIEDPFVVLGFIVSFFVFLIVLYNFLKDKPDVKIEIGESKIRQGAKESVSSVSITVRNKGKRAITIKNIGISFNKNEKVLEGVDVPLHEHDYIVRYYPIEQLEINLQHAIQTREYKVFTESDDGERYWSNGKSFQ